MSQESNHSQIDEKSQNASTQESSLPAYADVKAQTGGEFDAPAINPDSTIAHSTAKSFGIRKVEILTDQYRAWYYQCALLFSIFLCAYTYSLDGTIRYTFQSYATASYSQHSLLATVNVIRAVVAAAGQPCIARLSDKFQRLPLIIVSILFYVIGTVIECQAYDVNRFAGGAVMYQIGYTGIMLLLQVTLADFSPLNWRLLYSFIPATPFIINTWISGNVSSALLAGHSWSYSIGIFAFIFPLSCVPLILCYVHMYFKAMVTDEWKILRQEEKASRNKSWISWKQNIVVDLFWELDVVGLLFIICVFGFILVPFTIAGGVTSTWQKASTIVPLVIGFVLIPFFVFWEMKVAKFPIVPWTLLKDRGVWSALCIAVLINFIWYMPNDYMYPVLLVSMNQSIKAATRITSLYSFVSVIAGPILGLVLIFVKRSKAFILFGICCWFISNGLLVHFRGANNGIDFKASSNGVIGAECLSGLGAGFFTYTTQVSIAANTNHEYTAVVISLYLSAYNIGSALGASVSGAVWTNKLVHYMYNEMENAGISNGTALANAAYADPYAYIVDHTWGTAERVPIVLAYAHTQKILCIIGLCLCVPLLLFAICLRDHKLEKVQSLDIIHDHEEGVKMNEGMAKGTVVLNDYDDDVIVKFLKRTFKRSNK